MGKGGDDGGGKKESCGEKLLKLPWLINVVKMCYLFTVVYEIVQYLMTLNVHFKLGGTKHPYYVLLFFVTLSTLLLVLDSVLIFLRFTNVLWKKSFLITLLMFNIVVYIPWMFSGSYLSMNANDKTLVSRNLADYTSRMQRFSHEPQSGNFDLEGKIVGLKQKYADCANDPKAHKRECFDKRLQDTLKCCNVDLGEYKEQTVAITDNQTHICPHIIKPKSVSSDNGTHTIVFNQRDCGPVLVHRYEMMLRLSSYGGLFCAFLFLLLVPFMYASFELDRRGARAVHVYQWKVKTQMELESQIRKAKMEAPSPSSPSSPPPPPQEESTQKSGRTVEEEFTATRSFEHSREQEALTAPTAPTVPKAEHVSMENDKKSQEGDTLLV